MLIRRPGRLPCVRALAAVAVISSCLLVAGCGSSRSTEAYCDTYQSGFDQIKSEHPDVDQYTHTDENPLVLLLSATSAYGDIVSLIGDMAKVAPDEIQTDTQRVHDTLKKQIDSAGETAGNAASGNVGGLIGNVASGLVDSITNAGAMNRMDKFVVAHCGGEHMFSASPQ